MWRISATVLLIDWFEIAESSHCFKTKAWATAVVEWVEGKPYSKWLEPVAKIYI